MRKLSDAFMNDLKEGVLSQLLERVKLDDTLMLAIRKDSINIYYRGGSLIRLKRVGQEYKAFFDEEYNKNTHSLVMPPQKVQNKRDVVQWVNAIPALKEVMDFYFSKKMKLEREFQQLVVRENNFSSISTESEYFILDIEFDDTDISARADMLAVCWGANDRSAAKRCKPVFIEMKYGDTALEGKAGLRKHLDDFDNLLSNDEKRKSCLEMMESQFSQLDDLGLIKYNQAKSKPNIAFDMNAKPEVVLLLANHNPRSTKLNTILSSEDLNKYASSEKYDLKFYVSSFAGYGMHSNNMCSLNQMRSLLDKGDQLL